MPIKAQAEEVTETVEATMMVAVTDIPVTSDSGNNIGVIKEGTEIYTLPSNGLENERLIQWNDSTISIQSDLLQEKNGLAEATQFTSYNKVVAAEVITLGSNTEVYGNDKKENVIALLNSQSEYKIYEKNNDSMYSIVIGNRIGYIDSQAIKQEDPTVKEEGTTEVQPITDGEVKEPEENDVPNVEDENLEDTSEINFEETLPEELTEENGQKEEENSSSDIIESEDVAVENSHVTTFSTIEKVEVTEEEQEPAKEVTYTFSDQDKFFEVLDEQLPVYDNSGKSLRLIGYLKKGEIYPRVRDYGNWHRIKFGSRYGYVLKVGTKPANGTILKNINKSYKNTSRTFTALQNIDVYDNTSGKLIPYATILKGENHPIVNDYGNWYRVLVSDRVGYVRKSEVQVSFNTSDRYFEVIEKDLPVYDNRTGKLIQVGTLIKGQVYPRVRDYGNWHRIQFGDYFGYVLEASTRPASASEIKNEIKNVNNSGRTFKAKKEIEVYDNSSGKLVPFATFKAGKVHPIIRDYGNWYEIAVSNRIGYVRKAEVEVEFLTSDKYFKVTKENLPVYDNRTGKLVQVGTLEKGQIYPRVRDYGNWHRINFGNYYGYVLKSDTTPDTGKNIKNLNTQYSQSKTLFTALADAVVYDNKASSNLVPFGTIKKGQNYPIVNEYGSWYRILLTDRVGYVHKNDIALPFTKQDLHFEVYQDELPIYDNSSGKLVPVGSMKKGARFERIRDYGNWHEITFAGKKRYVRKIGTKPVKSSDVKYQTKANTALAYFIPNKDIDVYQRYAISSKKLGVIKKDERYPLIGITGAYYKINISGVEGYVIKNQVALNGKIVTAESLPIYRSYNEMSDFNLHLKSYNPDYTRFGMLEFGENVIVLEEYSYGAKIQTLDNQIGWVQKSYLVENVMDAEWLLLEDRNLRSGKSVTSTTQIGLLTKGTKVHVIDYDPNSYGGYRHWYKVQTSDGTTGWIVGSNSSGKLIVRTENNPNEFTVFTDIRTDVDIKKEAIDSYINSKTSTSSLMRGLGQTYVTAAKESGLSTIYLLAHSALETGWGTSKLVKDKNNFFGIAAYDACAYTCADGWDSPEEGLIGGANWIAKNYEEGKGRYTVDHMRNNLGIMQYATDEAWHQKIANIANDFLSYIKKLF